MNNLIKNELYKILHKKFIYIMAILIIVLRILFDVIINVSLDFDFSSIYAGAAEQLEKAEIEEYSADEISMLVMEKNIYDSYKVIKENKYKSNSWQSYEILNGHVMNDISCMNNSKYVEKNDDNYQDCKQQYEEDLNRLKDNNWQHFIKLDIESAQEEKELLKGNEILSKDEYEEQLASIENKIKAYNYRLEYEIPYSSSLKSSLLDNYVYSFDYWQTYQHDENKIIKHEELVEKRQAEKDYEVVKYKVENNKLPKTDGLTSSQEYVLNSFVSVSSFMVILIVVLGATTISEEFSKGTIKQLLLKPFTRTQIIISKYISCLIVFIVFMLGLLLTYSVIDGIFFGFGDLFAPYITYNATTGKIVEINTFVYAIINIIGLLPHYLILFTVGFFISVLFENGVVGIIIPFVLDTFVEIINALMPQKLERFASFLPTSCWELNGYLFGGLPSNQYSSFGKSLVIDIVFIILLLILSISIFKKKDIKNQ